MKNKFIKISLLLLIILFIQYISNAELKEVYIYCEQDDWDYIYENWREEIYIPCSIKYNEQEWTDCEMRFRGDGSKKYPRKSIKVKFNEELFFGKDKLNLNVDYLDKSRIHAYMASYVFKKSGAPTFNSEFYRVYLNDEFSGLYIAIENMDEIFLKDRGFNPNNNLYKAAKDGSNLHYLYGLDRWEKKTNEMDTWNDLYELMIDLNNYRGDDFYNYIKINFDYDNMINYMATAILLSHGSTYNHNYYLYNNKDIGKWQLFAWDMDKTFSQYSTLYQYRGNHGPYFPDNPLHLKCLNDERIFCDIQERIDILNNTIFNEDALFPVVDSLYNELQYSILEDTLFNYTDASEWNTTLNTERNFIRYRYKEFHSMITDDPTLFEISLPDSMEFGDVEINWERAKNNSGVGEIRYTIYYGPEYGFNDEKAVIITDYQDTSYTITGLTEDDNFYYMIEAYNTETEGVIEGFNKLNKFHYSPKVTKFGGTISSNHKLTIDKSPYLLDEPLHITKSGSLTIEPGVELYISQRDGHNIEGDFSAIGTSNRPIKIYSKYAFETVGLVFNNLDNFTLENVKVKNVYLALVESNADIKNTRFRMTTFNNKTYTSAGEQAIYKMTVDINSTGKKINVDGVKFKGNSQIEGLMVWGDNNILIENCEFQNCADALEFTNARENTIIRNNTVIDCYDDAIDFNSSKGMQLEENTLINIVDKGFSIDALDCGNNANVYIKRNIIKNAGIGIGIKNNADCIVTNNTLDACNTGMQLYIKQEAGGDDYIPPTIDCQNTIFYNTPRTVSYANDATGSISYSLSNTENIEGESNILADPEFENPLLNTYALKLTSPCIDAGNPNSELDPDGTIADIGAVYYAHENINTNKTLVINEINYNSSIDNNTGDWVEIFNNSNEDENLGNWTFYDKNDEHKFVFPEITLEPKEFIVIFQDKDLYRDKFKDANPSVGEMEYGFSSKGEILRLFNKNKELVDWVEYDNNAPWDSLADGLGATLELINPDYDNALAESWKASNNNGTPCRKNSVYDNSANPNDTIPDDTTKIDKDIRFTLFPNPATEEINISYNDTISIDLTYQVFNIEGGVVLNGKFEDIEQTANINIDELYIGTYYLYLYYDKKHYLIPFIKQ